MNIKIKAYTARSASPASVAFESTFRVPADWENVENRLVYVIRSLKALGVTLTGSQLQELDEHKFLLDASEQYPLIMLGGDV